MDQGHDRSVLVLKGVHVCVTQRVIIFNDTVTADLAVAEEAEERRVGEDLAKSVGLHVRLVVIVVLASTDTSKHEPQGVFLWNPGCA